jgi:isoaspartyl peptidase/L-asparaginase-like protein (Ntn-hydrolase superfamily)
MKPVIIVHGGAKTISEEKLEANRIGCRAAVEAGWRVLCNGDLEHGLEMCAKDALISEEQRQEWEDEVEVLDRPNTVGCVALDVNGNLVAGTSTGGITGQSQGRVGDTALVGCGLYADNRLGACSTTGDGESIIPVVLAKTAIDALAGGWHPNEAAQQAIATLASLGSGRSRVHSAGLRWKNWLGIQFPAYGSCLYARGSPSTCLFYP